MTLPTSAALEAHLRMIERLHGPAFGLIQLRGDLAELRRLQHAASTRPGVTRGSDGVVVFDLDAYRAAETLPPDDPEAA